MPPAGAQVSAHDSEGKSKCKQCHSERLGNFSGELAIHFTGLAGLNRPIVWVFPNLLACLDCGLTEFIVPERELQVLKHGTPIEGAVVWLGSGEEE
jgi:hypothetical protein